MQSRWIGPALLIALAGVGDASAAGSPAFCRTWLKVCNQTCPSGPGTCTGVCDGRYQTCLSSGCFPFNVPGPRCQDSTKDQTATAKASKAIDAGRPIGCGPKFGRPCD